jgi:hypothetical protein
LRCLGCECAHSVSATHARRGWVTYVGRSRFRPTSAMCYRRGIDFAMRMIIPSRIEPSHVPALSQVPRSSRRAIKLRITGTPDTPPTLVEIVREQLLAGVTRLVIDIDELSMAHHTGIEALEQVHNLRAEYDAVIVWSRNPMDAVVASGRVPDLGKHAEAKPKVLIMKYVSWLRRSRSTIDISRCPVSVEPGVGRSPTARRPLTQQVACSSDLFRRSYFRTEDRP